MMAQVFVFLTLTWDTQMELLVPGLSLEIFAKIQILIQEDWVGEPQFGIPDKSQHADMWLSYVQYGYFQ